ncbi:hypothetical protein [Geobacter sp.]|uniref:hypothetical protein n=1 Tax=Geobacter sp. TaxID=46610 RepID=UPI0027BA9C90|nr:hypothetical protein [Geobacter sp.]
MSKCNKIIDFVKHTKNGYVIPENISLEERMDKFPIISDVVAVSWYCNHNEIKIELGADFLSPGILPDRTGVVLLQPSHKFGHNNAVIVNADGTTRFTLINPYRKNPYYYDGDEYEFLCTKIEGNRFGMIVGVGRKDKDTGGYLTTEWFYELDANTGSFDSYHVVR